jgi:hypothetical protein
METQLALIVVEGRLKLMRSMDPAVIDDHHDVLAGFAEGRHHLMEILAQLLGIKMGDDFIEDFGGAILDGANDAEQYPTGDAAPGARADPRLAFERLFTSDLTLAEWTQGEAVALGAAPPAQPGQGKAPEDRFIFIEQNDLTTAGLVLEGGEFERAIGEVRGGRIESSGRAAVGERLFFKTQRTLSRPSWRPVWWANTVASSRQLHWEDREPCWRGS